MNVTETIKFNKLKEENEKIKKELTELKQQQLYKEDFIIGDNCNGSIETYSDGEFYTDDIKYVLKDNSKYDTLPSKDDK